MLEKPYTTPLPAYIDTRGRSHFDIFPGLDKGQVNIGMVHPGVVKAFHYHKLQWDHWFCPVGNLHVICVTPKGEVDDQHVDNYDVRHFYIGEHNPVVLHIPPMTWHGYTGLGTDKNLLLYWVTEEYNRQTPDEYRVPWNVFGSDLWLPKNE